MYNELDSPAKFVLQEYNCGPLRALSIATYLSNEYEPRMKCHAQSADLNRSENVLVLLELNSCKRRAHLSNTIYLFNTLYGLYNNLSESYFASLLGNNF